MADRTRMSRPEYVHCVLLGEAKSGEPDSWCGRRTPNLSFMFVDPTHAILSARHGSRLLICPECAKCITETLAKGTWSDD